MVAALVIAIASGSRSGWRTQAQMAEGQGAAPPIDGTAVKRWFFWYVLPVGSSSYGARGPEFLTDQEAFELERQTKTATLGVQLYRWVWVPSKGVWVYDTRNAPGLLASREIRDQQGNVVGAVALTKPLTGRWPYTTLPARIHLAGKLFKKARFLKQKPGVVGQYREAVAANSMHLYVLHDGTYLVTHLDEANPDMGAALAHLWKDVVKPMKVA
jgi:hypothetical protein